MHCTVPNAAVRRPRLNRIQKEKILLHHLFGDIDVRKLFPDV